MTKEEILQAIEETIVSNNQKAITAESLKLLLIEMLNSSGSGSGSVIIYAGTAQYEGTELKGVILSEEEKSNNAEGFKIFKESKGGTSIVLNNTGWYSEMLNVPAESVKTCTIVPTIIYVDSTSAATVGAPGECIMLMIENMEFMLLPTGDIKIAEG